ncbi:MAG: hypothetical protein HY293_16950 [Planctomycetes bacterium]|nr:hypothetical protein [Planctomycetota bacterium]
MTAEPFLCPICSERQNFAGGATFTCSGCGSGFKADRIDPLFRVLSRLWTPDEKDGDAFVRRVSEAIRAEGLVVNPIAKQSYDLKGGESIRLCLLGDSLLLAAATGAWSEDLALMMLNVLIPISNHLETKGTPPRFAILASTPLPDPIRFLFAHTPQARFERLAMGQTEIWDAGVPVDPAATEALTRIAAKLVEICFQLPLKETIDDAQLLNELVLRRFRFPLAPEAPLPGGGYLPAASLLLIGLLVGRAIRASAQSPCDWAAAPDSNFGLTLSTFMRSTGNRGRANVIDKMFKLYQNGAEDSVDFLARHVVDESKP